MALAIVPAEELPKFRRRVLSWFCKCRRDLPWRRTKNAYHIWISEIMLQQTRVAAVIPYYEKFLASFPDVRSLARASADRVLANWAGLGYYSRARNLHRAAKEIAARHEGQFPRNYEAALALPGIGRYTAAAVLSIAYREPLAVLDGNVARLLARIGALRGDLRAQRTSRTLEAAAQRLLARKAPGTWNEALMELGATICTPKSPRCQDCPAAKWCRARRLGIAESLPLSRKKPAAVDVTLSAAVFLDPQGRTLVVRRSAGDGVLFSRMWQFPAVESAPGDSRATLAEHLRQKFGATAIDDVAVPLAPARHTVTFRRIRLLPYLIRVARLPQTHGAKVIALSRIARLPISNATRKVAQAAMSHPMSDRGEADRSLPDVSSISVPLTQ